MSTTPRCRSRAGQALIEYVLMISLVAVGLIAILLVVRNATGNVFNNAANQVAGSTICPYGDGSCTDAGAGGGLSDGTGGDKGNHGNGNGNGGGDGSNGQGGGNGNSR